MYGRMSSMAVGDLTWQGGMGNSSIRMISIARSIQLSKPIYPNSCGMGKSRKGMFLLTHAFGVHSSNPLHLPTRTFNPTYRSGNSHLRANERPHRI